MREPTDKITNILYLSSKIDNFKCNRSIDICLLINFPLMTFSWNKKPTLTYHESITSTDCNNQLQFFRPFFSSYFFCYIIHLMSADIFIDYQMSIFLYVCLSLKELVKHYNQSIESNSTEEVSLMPLLIAFTSKREEEKRRRSKRKPRWSERKNARKEWQ